MSSTFESMSLNEKLMQAVQKQKYTTPTEIQERAIPPIMRGGDILATADTGSGKTLAFVLPALERILIPSTHPTSRGPRVLILAPTRELANQIAETTYNMGEFIQFRFGPITGGVAYHHQERMLRNGCDLIIATPGRLMDHMDRGLVDFSRIELFILDEADRMLDMGFRQDIELIQKSMPKERQTLLFSATLDGPIQNIAKQFLKNPEIIKLANNTRPHALITQCIYQTDDYRHKCSVLEHILQSDGVFQTIVFTKTKRGTEELAERLTEKNIPCAFLHGDVKQSRRSSTLARMSDSRKPLRVLIATDVAARGLDVKTLSHVVNFDVANTVDDHVHRTGRTGRCGTEGTAITLVGPGDWSTIADIERVMGQKLERRVIEGLEPRQVEPRRNGGVVPFKNKPRPGSGRGRSSSRFSDGPGQTSRFAGGGQGRPSRFSGGGQGQPSRFAGGGQGQPSRFAGGGQGKPSPRVEAGQGQPSRPSARQGQQAKPRQNSGQRSHQSSWTEK